MTKAELVALIHERTALPLGTTFVTSALDDLIKLGLVDPGPRRGNVGRKPNFEYRWRDCHRIRFIVILQARGMTSRNALRLQLFWAGCRLPISEVRQALLQEYRSAAATLNGQTRSTAVDNRKTLTPKRRASLLREFGPLDTRLADAGLQTPPDQMIAAMRMARQEPLSTEPVAPTPEFVRLLASGNMKMGDLARELAPQLSGLFLMGSAPDDEGMDSVEGLIRNATDDDFKRGCASARAMLGLLATTNAFGVIPKTPEGDQARNAIVRSIRRHPSILALFLFIGLKKVAADAQEVTKEQAEFMAWILKRPKAFEVLFSDLPEIEKGQLFKEYFDEFKLLGIHAASDPD